MEEKPTSESEALKGLHKTLELKGQESEERFSDLGAYHALKILAVEMQILLPALSSSG